MAHHYPKSSSGKTCTESIVTFDFHMDFEKSNFANFNETAKLCKGSNDASNHGGRSLSKIF